MAELSKNFDLFTHEASAHDLTRILLDLFSETYDPQYLVQLYSLSTPFCTFINEDTSDLFGLFYSLSKLKRRAFQGRSFRCLTMSEENLDEYRWALEENDRRIINTRSFCSTSVDEDIATAFQSHGLSKDKIDVMMIFDFDRLCESAVRLYRISNDLPNISAYEGEREVLIMPGTLFRVTKIENGDEHQLTKVFLNYFPEKFRFFSLLKSLYNLLEMLRQIAQQ